MLAALYRRYSMQLAYLFFGVLTTLINYGVFWLLNSLWVGGCVLTANGAAFVCATLFAFMTNKRYVFHSRSRSTAAVARELAAFTAARMLSFCVEEGGLYAAAYLLGFGRYAVGPIDGVMAAKVVLSVIAVILNYYCSKLWIFPDKRESEVDARADPSDSSGLQ